jgi:hypothetical protein
MNQNPLEAAPVRCCLRDVSPPNSHRHNKALVNQQNFGAPHPCRTMWGLRVCPPARFHGYIHASA